MIPVFALLQYSQKTGLIIKRARRFARHLLPDRIFLCLIALYSMSDLSHLVVADSVRSSCLCSYVHAMCIAMSINSMQVCGIRIHVSWSCRCS